MMLSTLPTWLSLPATGLKITESKLNHRDLLQNKKKFLEAKMNIRKNASIWFVILLLLTPIACGYGPRVIYTSGSATCSTFCGESWDTAYKYLQDALVLLKNSNLLVSKDLCKIEISFITAILHGILWRITFEKPRMAHL